MSCNGRGPCRPREQAHPTPTGLGLRPSPFPGQKDVSQCENIDDTDRKNSHHLVNYVGRSRPTDNRMPESPP
jgi:hypothetical protein